MKLELNLWLQESGDFSGNLNNKTTFEKKPFSKLVNIDQFCEYTIKRNLLTIDELSEFINCPDRDHNALYAWTKDSTSIIWWNPKHEISYAIFNGKLVELPQGKIISPNRLSPTIYFRTK